MHQEPLTIWMDRALLWQLAAEADFERPNETGGILLGYRNGRDIVIRAYVDAGPKAQRWPHGMRPDADYQAAAVATAFTESQGTMTYLGDWHTHPGSAPSPSKRDRKTLRNIAVEAEAQCPEPLMLILGDGEAGWAMEAWVGRLGRLGRWGPLTVSSIDLILFEDD